MGIVWLVIALVLVIIADMILKSQSFAWVAMILGAIAALPVKQAYKTMGFAHTGIVWASLVVMASLLVGKVYYSELLTYPKLIGGVLAIGAIYLAGK